MTDCVNGANDFLRIEKFFRKSIIESLSKVIGKHQILPIWSGVINEDWDHVVTDANFLKRYPKPLDLCFDHIVQQMLNLSRNHGFAGGVAPMFSDQKEYGLRMMEVYSAYRRHSEWAKFLRPISFGSPRQVIPLQAADMLVYGIALDRFRTEYPKTEWTFDNIGPFKFMSNMAQYRGLRTGGCYDANALKGAIAKFHS